MLAAGASLLVPRAVHGAFSSPIRLSCFRADVTPPLGSPLCGGWIKPVEKVSEPLLALGVVLQGDFQPIVLCAVDWCEVHNRDHYQWREALARAVGTTADRVAVQSLHQHNAPIADTLACEALRSAGSPFRLFDTDWGEEAIAEVARAARGSLPAAQQVTHVAAGSARVEQVASNRRLLGSDGKVRAMRHSATRDAAIRELPEGTIDSELKSIALFNGEEKLAVLHYYATHPMSYYGDGVVSSDFVGLARQRRSDADGVVHIYFTGCGGNITAGKYNDGSPANRVRLADRIHSAMLAAERTAVRHALDQVDWRVEPLPLQPPAHWQLPALMQSLHDPALAPAKRGETALKIAYLQYAPQHPIPCSCLSLGKHVRIVHLPGEPFVEYQLFAQQIAAERTVAVAGYGDGGPGYLPLERSFTEGGYEPTWAFARPDSEKLIKTALEKLLG